MNTDGIKPFSTNFYVSNENSNIKEENSAIKPAESEKQVPTSSSHHQQDSSSLNQRAIEPPRIHLCRGHIGGDPSRNPHLPGIQECLIKIAYSEASALWDSGEPDLSKINERIFSRFLPEFFTSPILNLLNYRVLAEKHDSSDEYVHLAAAMCNALGEEYQYIVDCCANCTHNFNFGFSHCLGRFADMLMEFHARKGLNLPELRQDIIDGLNTDRQTLVEKIAHQEIGRVNTILQQGSSIEDKYEPVGNLALIFFALSANNLKEANHLFREACFKDADGKKIDRNKTPPVYSKEFTTDPTDTYQYVYYSVRHIKDMTHLQRLVDQIKNHLIPDKGTASANYETRLNQEAVQE